MEPHPVFYVSDRSGHTAETLARSLLAQFPGLETQPRVFPFVDSREQAMRVTGVIQEAYLRGGRPPLVFTTLIDEELREILRGADACVIDLFGTFIGPIEEALGRESAHTAGLSRHEVDEERYQRRIEAVEFAMKNDDGIHTARYQEADLIVAGVSRTGKTPTCIYLAMNFGVKACNYPLVHEDFDRPELPEVLLRHRERVVGLTISPERLQRIRQHRRPDSRYAAGETVMREIHLAERMFARAGIPCYDTSDVSVEEVAARIMRDLRLLQSS